LKASPTLITPVKLSKSQGLMIPTHTATPNPAAVRQSQICITKSNRRRSITSANVPAGRAMITIGRLVATCTSATMTGEGARLVINQAPPTSCIQFPTLDMNVAIHNQRKTA